MVRWITALAFSVLVGSPLCADIGKSGPLEFGNVSGQPGEVVEVPILATFDDPLILFFIAFQFDSERLEFLRFTVKGTSADGVSPVGIAYRTFDPGDGICGVGVSGEAVADLFHIPPSQRVVIGKLVFRVLASAAVGAAFVKPVERVPGTGGTTSYTLDLGGSDNVVSSVPEPLVPGSIAVIPPAGPRPVGDFRCEQFLDRVLLSYTLTETYDRIEISRNGSAIATIPGIQATYTDPLPGVGVYEYSAVSWRGGAGSIPVACEVRTTLPAAPPVKDAECGGGGVTWTDPLAYDSISVIRNGELIATLPGSASSYSDPSGSGDLTIYGIVGELEGYRSPQVNCMANGQWIMEVGDVQVPVGTEKIVVPIYATNPRSVVGVGLCLEIDMDRLRFSGTRQEVLQGTVGYPEPEYLPYGAKGACGYPAAGIAWDFQPPREPEKDLQVGLRQRIFNFILKPKVPLLDGETLSASLLNPTFTLWPGISQPPDVTIPGQIRIGSAGPKSVQGLGAKVASGGSGGGAGGQTDVLLSWRNGSPYEKVTIERNGIPIAEVPGSSTAYRDPQVVGGVYTYKVSGVSGGKASFPAQAFLTTLTAPGTFLRGDSNRDGKIDLADPITTIDFLFRGGKALPCEDAADTDDSGELDVTDAILGIRYLFFGGVVVRAPGTAYPWFDPTPDLLGCEG